MRRRAFLAAAAGLGAAGLGAIGLGIAEIMSGSPQPRYTFADDFDGPAGSAPDPSKWTYDLGGGGWGNDELEIYTSSRENSFLDGNGNLVIRATKTTGQGTTTYRSARLKTLGKFTQYHGTFEARIKLDPQPGTWPAWWMMGANIGTVGWPKCGEVDILENFGGAADVVTSVHTPKDAGVATERGSTAVNNTWHTWRVHWDAAGFTFFKDGTQYLDVSPSQLPNWPFSSGVPMFMLLNLAIGGGAGSPASTRFPVDMLVDYVRVW
jgi:beta-glucanase (GH16 family)